MEAWREDDDAVAHDCMGDGAIGVSGENSEAGDGGMEPLDKCGMLALPLPLFLERT